MCVCTYELRGFFSSPFANGFQFSYLEIVVENVASVKGLKIFFLQRFGSPVPSLLVEVVDACVMMMMMMLLTS